MPTGSWGPTKFKIGDRIKVIWCCPKGSGVYLGQTGVVNDVDSGMGVDGDHCYGLRLDGGAVVYASESELSLIKNKTTMSKLSSMVKRLLDKDSQTLYKAGFITDDLWVSDEGKRALWGILFEEHKAALLKEAEEKLAEEKE